MNNKKKKLTKGKKVIIIVAVVIVALFIVIAATPTDESETSAPTGGNLTAESTAKPTESETKPVPARKEATGKSDKNCDEYFDGKATPTKMLNDTTGNWKLCRAAGTSDSFEAYALDYYNRYFTKEESTEIHWIVNFTNKTTTSVACRGTFLDVNIYEYVDGEEHDAHKIGDGQLYSSYYVWLDNGDIEPISADE